MSFRLAGGRQAVSKNKTRRRYIQLIVWQRLFRLPDSVFEYGHGLSLRLVTEIGEKCGPELVWIGLIFLQIGY